MTAKQTPVDLSPEEVTALFTRASGEYVFARWGRPIAPVVFGVDDAALGIFKGAIEAVVLLAGHSTAEMDPELGANVMFFVTRTWDELLGVPKLAQLVPDFCTLIARLTASDANQYRFFRFDQNGAIKAAFVFLRLDAHLAEMAAEDLALAQAVQIICLWSDRAFMHRPVLANAGGVAVLRQEIAAIIRAAYVATLPATSNDPAHALRLWARLHTL